YGRERDCNHFRRRRVRRRKYFSRSERRIGRLWRTTDAQSAAPVPIGRSRPGDFIVKKGRRGPFLTVSKLPVRGAFLCPGLSHCAVEEGDYLRAVALRVGAERGRAGAVGYAVGHRPRDGVGVVARGGDVGKAGG